MKKSVMITCLKTTLLKLAVSSDSISRQCVRHGCQMFANYGFGCATLPSATWPFNQLILQIMTNLSKGSHSIFKLETAISNQDLQFTPSLSKPRKIGLKSLLIVLLSCTSCFCGRWTLNSPQLRLQNFKLKRYLFCLLKAECKGKL